MPADLKRIRDGWYEDVAVLAFPTPGVQQRIESVDEKALYYRAPYTSQAGVVPFIPAPASYEETPGAAIRQDQIVDLTDMLKPDGRLTWDVPAGEWTVLRFGKRNNGAVTRPAPRPGLGFESDKFSAAAFDAHFEQYLGKLIRRTGPRKPGDGGGWEMIHIDSWEMGAQNWSDDFRRQFERRRGYDPLPYLPTYTGRIVGSLEQSERFLWDVRQTSSELIVENHALRFKELGRRYGFPLSIEPYDMNPAADLDLGAVADVPMGEFWSDGFGFNSAFSAIEAASIGHVLGRPVVAAEAFTAMDREAWKLYPGRAEEPGRLGLRHGTQPARLPHLRAQAVRRPAAAGRDHGALRRPLGPRPDLVADGGRLSPLHLPLPVRPVPRAARRRHPVPRRRGRAARLPPAFLRPGRHGHAAGQEGLRLRRRLAEDSDRAGFGRGRPNRVPERRVVPRPGAAGRGDHDSGAAGEGRIPGRGRSGRHRRAATQISVARELPSLRRAGARHGREAVGRADAAGRRRQPPPYGRGRIFWGGELSATVSGELYPGYAATTRVLEAEGVRPDCPDLRPLPFCPPLVPRPGGLLRLEPHRREGDGHRSSSATALARRNSGTP